MRLKALLEQKQLTLAEVARAINMSAPSVHRWTRGGEIEYENLRALADYLEVNWVWLRYGDEAIEGLQETMSANGSAADERRKHLGQIMESEARMTLAQDMASIVTWEWNVLTDELTGSPNCEQIFGQTIVEIRPKLLPFESLGLEALITQFKSSNHPHEWEFNLPKNEVDSERWFVSRGRLIFDAQERPLKVVGVSIDITQSIHMRNALEQSEYLMRKVIETIPVGLWIADQKGRITKANPEAERIWGGAKLVELEHYGEYKGWWESTGKEIGSSGWTLARAIQQGEESRGEIVNIEAFDGKQRTIIMSAIPLLDADNEIIGAIEVNQDITALKRTEESLKSIVEQWKAIFEQPLVGIAYYRADSDSLHVNARFAELVQRSMEELAGESLANLLDEETNDAYQAHLCSTPAGKTTTFKQRGKLRCKAGETADMQLCIVSSKQAGSVLKTLVFVF
ncbi:MAG: PAS domain S-box protein [Methylophilaceae bacterium]